MKTRPCFLFVTGYVIGKNVINNIAYFV